jgi:hypothetical protein
MNRIPEQTAKRAQTIINQNQIGLTWQNLNQMKGMVAMGKESIDHLVAAFRKFGYQIRQLGPDWEISKIS